MHRSILMASLALAVLLSAAAGAASRGFSVPISQLIRVQLHGVAANVVVADPAIVDAKIIDTHSVVLLGKGYGVTQILVTDHDGHTLLDSKVSVLASDQHRMTMYTADSVRDYDCTGPCQALVLPPGASQVAAIHPTAAPPPAVVGSPSAGPPAAAGSVTVSRTDSVSVAN